MSPKHIFLTAAKYVARNSDESDMLRWPQQCATRKAARRAFYAWDRALPHTCVVFFFREGEMKGQ